MNIVTMHTTPEMAKKWLENNGKNRPLSKSHAQKLADMMKSGEWVLNGETICFDDNGMLLDGQHRLTAIVLSGVTIEIAVAFGVTDHRAFETYDSVQRVRGADQVAQMKGVKNAKNVTAAARVVAAWQAAETADEFSKIFLGGKINLPPSKMSEKAVEIEAEYDQAKSMIGENFVRLTKSGSPLIGMVIILARINKSATESFLYRVKTGVVTGENDPALIFRDRMMSGKGSVDSDKKWKIASMAFLVKSWNYNLTGKKLSNLRWRQEGDSPEKFPSPIGGGK